MRRAESVICSPDCPTRLCAGSLTKVYESHDTFSERQQMYNWDVQNAIAAFVDSLRPMWPAQRELYYHTLYGFADMQSHLLTLLGYPPVA